MANLNNVIPSPVMAAMVEEALRKSLVASDVVNNKYAGTIANGGDSVQIPTIGEVTISDYAKNGTLTYENIDSSSQVLSIDQQKSFSFSVDDIDDKQAIVDVAALAADRAGYQLRDTSDKYVLQTVMSNGALVKDTGSYDLGDAATPIQVSYDGTTGDSVLEALGGLAQRLDEQSVPQEGRFAIIPPWFHARLVQAKVLEQANGTSGDDAFTNGRIGRAFGFDLRMSVNLTNAITTGTEIFAGIVDATSFVGQLLNTETLRLETTFGDGVRGLWVYGAKVVSGLSLAKMVASAA